MPTGARQEIAVGRWIVIDLVQPKGTVAWIAPLARSMITVMSGRPAGGSHPMSTSGQALRENSRETAVIGRIGGEESLVADLVATADATAWGEWLCGAIAATPFSVTASVGTATIALSHFGAEDVNERRGRLLAEADAAMYAAKRNGGNQARGHHMT